MTDSRQPPYPADTRAKGWRFELDYEQIRQSDTWALATPDLRPWLLMLWMTAWEQVPCGSMPGEDGLIAARIGMKPAVFAKTRTTLLRGWWRADDGRLYHDTLAERVREMLETKSKDRERKAEYRRRKEAERQSNPPSVPRDSQGTDGGSDDTGTGTGTTEKNPPAARVPPKTRGMKRCPADFDPSDELWAEMRAECPAVDLAAELRAMKDHEFRDSRTDWPAAFRNWIRRSAKTTKRAEPSGETAWQRSQRERVEQMTGGRVSAKPPGAARKELEFADVFDTDTKRLG